MALTTRFALLLPGALGLMLGLWSGLVRLGLELPAPSAIVPAHGPLMVCGFLGVVITLERAVALRRAWGYLGPAFAGLGVLSLVGGAPVGLPALFATAASVVALAIFLVVLRGERALHHGVMALGVGAWIAGNVSWLLGRPYFEVVGLWIAFLTLTIAGERLELRRVLSPAKGEKPLFLLSIALVLAGAAFDLRVLGAGALALAAWLVRYDIARRTVRLAGLTRFMAVCLLAGYAWLAVGGALALTYGNPVAGPVYDAILHAVFVGFVFSMIFGHAPIILPAVLGVRIDFRPRFYAHLGLLHGAMLVRTVGDLAGSVPLRQAGGIASAAAIGAFLVSTALAARRPRAGRSA